MLGCKVILTYKRKRLTGNSNGNAHGNECRNLYNRLINKTPSKDEAGSSSMETLGTLDPEKDAKDGDLAGPSSTNMDSTEPSKKMKVSSEAREDLTVPKTASMDISASLSDDKPGVLSCDSSEPTKFKAPLMTFIRRCKRKRVTDVGDTGLKSPSDGTKCSTVTHRSEIACDGTFSHEAGSNLKPREEVHHDTGGVVPHAENKITTVVSTCPYAEPAPDSEVLTFEGENPVVDLNSLNDGLNKDEQVLDQNDAQQDLTACRLRISLNKVVKDSSSDDKVLGKKAAKEDSLAILNNGLKERAEASHLFLDLSITPSDSSGTVDCNAYMESNSQRRSGHGIRETLLGSMDSTSRSHAAVLHQRYPPEMLFGESSSTQNSHLCPDSWANIKGPVTMADFKDNDKPSLVPLDFFSKKSCLQLFAEERAEKSTRSVYTRLEETNSGPKRNSPPFLGLGLPTRPKTTRFACDSSFTTFPFSNPVDQTLESFEPSSSQLTSLRRHKSVFDGIVNQARGLSERDLCHTKLKLYNSSWTEEELDSLWVGVRRYGRKNWNAMIRDPRLRFSSWRVARDLAEQWEEEQCKLLQGATAGNCREITAEETRLSLGDVYNSLRERKVSRRARFKSKAVPKHNPPSMPVHGSLPHWMREVVFSSPASWRQPLLAPAVASVAHPHMMPPNWPCFDQYNLSSRQEINETNQTDCGFRQTEAQSTSGGGHHLGPPPGTSPAADVIVIESDASSEETISDDHNGRQ